MFIYTTSGRESSMPSLHIAGVPTSHHTNSCWDDRPSLKTATICYPKVGSDYMVTRGGGHDRRLVLSHAHSQSTNRLTHNTKSGELQTPHYYKPVQIDYFRGQAHKNVTVRFTSKPLLASVRILFYSCPGAEIVITGSKFAPWDLFELHRNFEAAR